jgi:hypothetical protein
VEQESSEICYFQSASMTNDFGQNVHEKVDTE